MAVLEFWDLTPRETYAVISAALWRDEHAQRLQVAQAWRIAALTRAKKLPTLKQLLNAGPAKPLKGRELERRRQEFSKMTAGLDANAIAKRSIKKEPDL